METAQPCRRCNGSGLLSRSEACPACDGTGRETPLLNAPICPDCGRDLRYQRHAPRCPQHPAYHGDPELMR